MNFWLLIPAIPTLVQTGIVLLLSWGTFWWGKPVFRGGFVMVPWRKKFGERWHYTTTLGLAMGTHAPHYVPEKLVYHEQCHVRQYVDLNCLGMVLGGIVAILDWRWGLALWASSGFLWLIPNFLTGWVRFGDAYYGSEHERSAYSQEKVKFDGVKDRWEL